MISECLSHQGATIVQCGITYRLFSAPADAANVDPILSRWGGLLGTVSFPDYVDNLDEDEAKAAHRSGLLSHFSWIGQMCMD